MNNYFLMSMLSFILGIFLASLVFAIRINGIYDTLGKFDKRMDCIFDRIELVIQDKNKKI